jgi:serine/threonine protein kinase
MAPECHGHGQVSPRTDVYSFGIIVLELLIGLPARKHQPLGWEAALMVVLCLLGQLQPPRRRARGASRSSRIAFAPASASLSAIHSRSRSFAAAQMHCCCVTGR